MILFKFFGFNMSFVLGKFAALVGWLIISGQLLLLFRKHYPDYTVLFLIPNPSASPFQYTARAHGHLPTARE